MSKRHNYYYQVNTDVIRVAKDNVAFLLKEIKTQNELGDYVSEIVKKEVYCFVDSVNSTEFFEASKNGIRAQIRVSLFVYDYENEEEIEFDGINYKIYRTFRKNDNIELYCSEKAGDSN